MRVRSQPGKGSVFSIEITRSLRAAALQVKDRQPEIDETIAEAMQRTGAVLIIEDDPKVRDLLDLLLKDQGCHTATAPDGIAALDLVARGKIRPDLILADYNLPNGLDGLQVVEKLRAQLHRKIPVIILTGDISTGTLRDIARRDCVQLNKPVRLKELTQAVQCLLPASRSATHFPPTLHAAEAPNNPGRVIFVIDDDSHVCDGVRKIFEADGSTVKDFATCDAFLEAYHPGREACLLVDAHLPGMSGLELLQKLSHANHQLPAIMITGNGDVPMAVQAMKAGAIDFIEKPFGHSELRASVERALEQSRDSSKLLARREAAANHIAALTPRQRKIMDLVLAGQLSKNIAADLGISQRTVETHRASIMKKTGAKSLPALARLALAAAGNGADEPPVQRESPVPTARRTAGT